MNNLIFPDLYCPFPAQINQHVDVLEDHAMEWALRFNLLRDELSYQRFRKSKFHSLAASTYPNCQVEELKIANDIIGLLFVWDDQCDISDLGKQPEIVNTYCNRFIEILNGAKLTHKDTPLTYALSDVRKRIIKSGNLTFFHHFVHSFEDYFNGCIEEANNRLNINIPTLENYIKIRSSVSAVALCLNLIEFCDWVKIPYILRNNEVFKKINQKAINIIAWSNDILSVQREISTGHVHNLVLILHYQQKLPLEKAIRFAVEMHDEEVRELINLEKQIPSVGIEVDGEISKYISGLHSWISGHIDWYSHSGRYQIAESTQLCAS
ncbi:MAG: terpene synthase family protein [Goleter apudmare HA4340-LM2]|jgi:5-epi-alpha-selinene synthase|nr:terpene synthase family protein [Goleter apudmare HA4340-LM2]